MGIYRLSKSQNILQSTYDYYNSKETTLEPSTKNELERRMLALEAAIDSGDRQQADQLARALEDFSKENCKKSILDYTKEILTAILIAFLLAVVVRQMWFEPYEIPTGSMRPTFREQDRITVTKTPFGLNIPMTTGHFIFEPKNVERTGVITFTSEGIKNLDEDTPFLGIFPYKKRLIKRTIGKPGDSLYFYGGRIYGVDKNGNAIDELITAPWMQPLEHIPFLKFSGEKTFNNKNIVFSQMNIPIGKVAIDKRELSGEIYNGKEWVKDSPASQKNNHSELTAYSDFFGMRNFAMARLLTKKELSLINPKEANELPNAPLYLELQHHASLTYPAPTTQDGRIYLNPLKSYIPLEKRHLDAIMDNMYTARLVFKNGRATRYSTEAPYFNADSPKFPGVPDGTYEFYHGSLEDVGFGATTSPAKKENPLYSRDAENVQKLFNLGIEMHMAYQPHGPYQRDFPTRYAYFRDGDLYLLGGAVIKKDDPTLLAFNKKELEKQKNSSEEKPYTAFKDYGPPLIDGKYDKEFIRTFGVTMPDKQYLLLGDNHAMSADSRVFGFIPEDNLQGAPSLILWPTGDRWGVPAQKAYPLFTLPRSIVWLCFALFVAIWYKLQRDKRNRKIVFKKTA